MSFPNWFSYTEHFFEAMLTEAPPMRCLQLGVFVGDASIWLMEHTSGYLVDVDTWEGSAEHDDIDFAQVEKCYDARIAPYDSRITKRKMTTEQAFAGMLLAGQRFDFVYVDAAHDAPSVFFDAACGFAVLEPGGLLAFDDNRWSAPSGKRFDSPAPAIAAFCDVYVEHIEVLVDSYQLWVRKR
jgi:predicted O-methyltransferase YrrM